MAEDHFWELAHLSDQQLLASLHGSLRAKRRALAEVVAHLAEVEERRLHLEAACGSLFYYCVQRLGMSEDEACRRIELARLARKFPRLFPELASGRIGLSVALLLKPVLSAENQNELIPAVRGASLQQTRELLAARFPRPDVPAQVRKLPERAKAYVPPQPPSQPTPTTRVGALPLGSRPLCLHPSDSAQPSDSPNSDSLDSSQPRYESPGSNRSSTRIEPLSAGRYRVQFTADASLKHKLQHARDLLRHAHPEGDLADVVSRALDLLLEDLMKRRFGARRKAEPPSRAARDSGDRDTATRKPCAEESSLRADSVRQTLVQPALPEIPRPASRPCRPNFVAAKIQSVMPVAPARPHVPRAARRAVLARDGLGCSWQDAQGHRCGSTAWLELDHRQPAGKGGGSQPENLRLLCRAHNRRSAEHEYGRDKIERAIAARRRSANGSVGA